MINIDDIQYLIKKENIETIFLDVDGVVMNSIECVCGILNERYNTNYHSIDILSWNFNEIKSDITSKEIEDIFNSQIFFDTVQLYDGVLDFIYMYRDKIILFSKGGCENLYKKGIYFGDIPLIGLPLKLSKGWLNMNYKGNALFIDDVTKNLVDSNAHCKILFKEFENGAEWNRNWNGLIMNSWK